jgi:hypothetical protein
LRRNTSNRRCFGHFPKYSFITFKKTENWIKPINEKYFETHKKGKISVEKDEMLSFYNDESHQIWLWWAIDHDV